MRATKLFVVSGIAIFAIFFLVAFLNLDERAGMASHAALGGFQFCGAAVSMYLLSKGRLDKISLLDWLCSASSVLMACLGLVGSSITLFAFYLIIRDRHDLNTIAAGTVAAAVAIQAIWAPIIFSKISFILLQIDAGVVGWLVSLAIPGTSWSGTVISTPSGHAVAIYERCASFHNLSLASLCWVTLTMVCLSLPMYELWHQGWGAHIFSGVATACAIIFVQASLVRRDHKNAEIRVATIS